MKRLAETIVGIYLGLGELSFIISIKFGVMGIFVLVWNLDTYLRGEGSNITGLSVARRKTSEEKGTADTVNYDIHWEASCIRSI